MYKVEEAKGLINTGNRERIKKCMKKAQEGKPLTVGFLGGSITQGCLSSGSETCYSYLVYDWWKKKFPAAEVTYINAGIGGTTSQFGVARVKEHLLKYTPDFILIEFAVNDENTEFFKETYEGLIRKTYGADFLPAVMLMNNVRYDNGENAEEMHLAIAKAYDLPMVSMRTTIWPEVEAGRIPGREITPDDLHPNDEGHRLVASVILYELEKIYEELNACKEQEDETALPAPLTANAYQESVLYQNYNTEPACSGFEADKKKQENILDIFRNGWFAWDKGSKIVFEITGTGIAVQYRKTVNKPTPVARVTVDDEIVMTLDGNFEEDWGDSLHIDTVLHHGELKKHKVEIELTETHKEDREPFYLVSVIGSD